MKAKQGAENKKKSTVDVAVSGVVHSNYGYNKHVILMCFVNESSFKTGGIQAMLCAAKKQLLMMT